MTPPTTTPPKSGQQTDLPQRRPSQSEFVAIVAMCFASIALAVDAMLPAMPQIAADLSPEAPQRVQLIIAAFLLGMGVGTLVVGPLSDAYGRKRVIAGGAVLFCLGALWSAQAQSLEALLVARVVMGLGGAAPRVVSLALLRDLYSGREMARITSFVMMVFTMVPAVAPLMGAAVLEVGSWRAIFFMLMAFSLLSSGWLMIRQPETLPMAARIPLRVGPLWASLRLVVSNRVVQRAVAVLSCVFGALFGTLTSVQQIFDQTLGMADSFPLWFMLVAVLGGTSTILNALLVVRLGMRRMVAAMLAVQLGVSSLMAAVSLAGPMPEMLYLATVVFWIASVFFMVGITVGNINAIALEPMGHVAGMAASVTAAVSTVIGAMLAIPIGLAFDGTPTPLALGIAGLCLVGLLITQRIERPAGA